MKSTECSKHCVFQRQALSLCVCVCVCLRLFVCLFVFLGENGVDRHLKGEAEKMQRALRVSETSTQAAATEAEGRASESSSAGKRTGEGTAVNSESGPPLQHIAHLWHHGSLTEREPVTPMLSLWL